MFFLKSGGQATIEYLLIFAFIVLLGSRFISGFGDFMGKSFGNISHVLSINLSTGVCNDHCFYSNYENGYGD